MIQSYQARKSLYPRHIFRIARASRTQVDNIFFLLEQDGCVGFGEASPNAFFHEDPFEVQMFLSGLSDYFRCQTLRTEADIARIWKEVWNRVAPSRASQCAVDLALWDLWSKLKGLRVSEAALGKVAWDIKTSATLGLCPKEEWPERLSEMSGFTAIKVKMHAEPDFELLQSIRMHSTASIRVDANGSWSGLAIGPLSKKLAELGVEFIEQPLPPEEDNRMSGILKESCLPIIADESCAGPADIPGLIGRFSGFNVKLVKCGGLTPALAMLKQGRELGLKTMVGCMLESSLLISAGAVAAQNADYADLDGSWLLGEDPFTGMEIVNGAIRLGQEPGWGVELKPPAT